MVQASYGLSAEVRRTQILVMMCMRGEASLYVIIVDFVTSFIITIIFLIVYFMLLMLIFITTHFDFSNKLYEIISELLAFNKSEHFLNLMNLFLMDIVLTNAATESWHNSVIIFDSCGSLLHLCIVHDSHQGIPEVWIGFNFHQKP